MSGRLLIVLSVSVLAVAGTDLQGESVLYGLLSQVNSTEGSNCYYRLAALRKAIDNRETWAMKVYDASGRPGSGFVWGNNYWLGSYSECRAIHTPNPFVLASTINRNDTYEPDAVPPFEVDFYVATLRHNTSIQVHVSLPNEDLISIGLCLPNICKSSDVSPLLTSFFSQKSLNLQKIYDVELSLEKVRIIKDDSSWLSQPNFIIVSVLLLTVIGLMIIGTIYDTVFWQPYLKEFNNDKKLAEKKMENVEINMNIASFGSLYGKDNKLKAKMQAAAAKNNPVTETYTQGPLGKFLLCFSIYTNTGILVDTNLGKDSIPAIHGLRFISMAWIIMVHTVFYLSDYADNKPQAFLMSEGFMVQIISNSTLSVDTFFFLSGFLVAYLYFKGKKDKDENKSINVIASVQEFGLMVLRRFLRLTPVYMMVLGIVYVNMSWYSRVSLFHMTERADLLCSKYWWRNLLYINNMFSREEMCMSWSWYLSNDMQFFILTSFLLILSTINMMLSVTILTAVFISSSLLTGIISYSYDYVPTLDQQYSMLNVLYDPPWTRIGPYIIGIATAYIVVKLNGNLPFGKRTVFLAWIIGASFNICCLFGLYERNISPLAAAIYVALSRTAWAVGIAWIIIACCTNNAGFINRILSFPAWIPLSRLTYCAYLLNPMLMNSVYLSSETPMHVDFLPLSTHYLGHLLVSYCCAFVLSLAVETPTVLLMRHLTEKSPKRNAPR